MRALLAGSCGGALKTGRAIASNREPYNKLMVSLMNAMGVAGDTFGDPSLGKGALPGVL
jgi:hypothetical protein